MSKFRNPRERAIYNIKTLLSQKEDKRIEIAGLMGTYDSAGNEVVTVENRDNFVYVRVNGSFSEVVEAFNERVYPEFDAKVLIAKSKTGNFYEVIGRDLGQYNGSWGGNAFYFPHALQHSFGSGENQGSDPVFLYKRQLLQPLAVRPQISGSMTAYVEGDFYVWNNNIKYFGGKNTVDFTPLLPTGNYNRFVTIYLNGETEDLGYITGNPFIVDIYTSGTVNYIPNVSLYNGIPLAAVLISTGTTSIDWDHLFDLRNFLNAGGSQNTQLHSLDPMYGYHTGTLRASLVTVFDAPNYFTGTVVEDVLKEIYENPVLVAKNNINQGRVQRINFIEGNGIGISPYFSGTNINLTFTSTGSSSSGSGHIIANATGTYPTRSKLTFYNYLFGVDLIVSDNSSQNSTDIIITGNIFSTHNHSLARFYVTGGSNRVELPDYAEYIDSVFYAGTLIDPLNYTLSGNYQIWFLSGVGAAGTVVVNYGILSI